jgi:hypothetical protein
MAATWKKQRMEGSIHSGLRMMKWVKARRSSLMSGKSQMSSGLMMREVFEAENCTVEAKKMKAIHATSGP